MARKLRIQYPDAIYHAMNRGDRREVIFQDDQDRRHFLDTLDQACEKTGWQVHAYCLMPNHFHLVLETPEPNLVIGMKWLLGTYTGRYNRRHKEFGHLFSGRYKALPVDGSGDGYPSRWKRRTATFASAEGGKALRSANLRMFLSTREDDLRSSVINSWFCRPEKTAYMGRTQPS